MAAPDQAHVKYPAQPPAPFKQHPGDPVGDIRTWLKGFDLFIRMIQANNRGAPVPDLVKNDYLCVNLGTEGLRTFSETPAYGDKDNMAHDAFQQQVIRHFGARVTKFKARYDFQHRQQEPDESIQQFETALRVLIKDCEYPEIAREGMLSTQLINGTTETQAQKELMAMEDIDLRGIVNHLLAHETARKESGSIKPAMTTVQVMRGQSRWRGPRGRGQPPSRGMVQRPAPQQANTPQCYNCGSRQHIARDSACPATGQTCSQCGKMGHFARSCRSASQGSQRGTFRGRGGFRGRRRGQVAPITLNAATINVVRDKEEGIQAQFWMSDGRNLQPISLQVDTGAEVTLIGEDVYRDRFRNLSLRPPPRKLTTVNGERLHTVGTISTKVQFGGRIQRGIVYVVKAAGIGLIGNNFLKPLKVVIDCAEGRVAAVKVDNLRTQFPKLFDETTMGIFRGQPHHIRVSSDAIPRAVRLRPIPLARRQAAIEEVKTMDQAGIWEPVQTSEWVHPLVVVPKPDGAVRITTDLTALNQHVIPERFPLPRITDLFVNMAGAKVFSKLDLRKGYFHIPLTEESKDYTTTITPIGLRRYCRLPMGLTDAASAFQRRVQQTLQGLDGVEVYIDDVVIHGKDQTEHDRRLFNALDRLQTADFRLQQKKIVLRADSIPAFGHIIGKDGIRPDPKNIDAIKTAPTPTNMKEVQRFLGMVNYFQGFLPDVASLAEPLRQLTRKETEFQWGRDQEVSFELLKRMLVEVTQLQVFDPQAPTIVTTDASDVGMGGVLSQIQQGKETPIAFYSRTLDDAERNYAATEREALAAIRTMERWENFLIGRKFKLRTDHQALRQLLQNPTNQRQSAKFQRWAERLAAFEYQPEYIRGDENKAADYLSRIQAKAQQYRIGETRQKKSKEVTVQAVKMEDILQATVKDEKLQRIKNALLEKKKHIWRKDSMLQPYAQVAEQLRVEDDGCIQRLGKIVVPESMRAEVLENVHIGHPGISRMKAMLRTTYWWPGVDKHVERMCKECEPCQRSSKTAPAQAIPETTIPRPAQPGVQYAIDIAGPFYNGKNVVVLIDYASRFPEILSTTETTSQRLIQWLTEIFDRYGNPQGLVSDNGPQFVSAEFEKFLDDRDIFHYTTSRYNPRENGLVERFNRYLKGGIEAFTSAKKPWEQGLKDLINSYRSAPQEEAQSPAEKFLGRPYRPSWSPNRSQPLRRRQQPRQEKMNITIPRKQYKYCGPSIYEKGERVLCRLPHVPKGCSPYSEPRVIQEVLGRYTFRLEDGSVWNARKLKPFYVNVRQPATLDFDHPQQQHVQPGPPSQPQLLRRSARETKGIPPKRLICEAQVQFI